MTRLKNLSLLSLLLLMGCQRYTIATRQTYQGQQARSQGSWLALANRELEAGLYHEAAKHFAGAIRLEKLTTDQYRQALDGQCTALSNLTDLADAYKSCGEAIKQPGSTSGPQLEAVEQRLRVQLGQAVETAVKSNLGAEARMNWRFYKDMPGADPELVRRWDQAISMVEKQNKLEAERAERLRQKEQEKTRQATRQGLLDRYAMVRRLDRRAFEQWVQSTRTAFGVPIFDRTEIVGQRTLYLWVRGGDFIGPNLKLFAEYADAFAAWCLCEHQIH